MFTLSLLIISYLSLLLYPIMKIKDVMMGKHSGMEEMRVKIETTDNSN